eukprot:4261905-Pyramimonas_sp.AAC.1
MDATAAGTDRVPLGMPQGAMEYGVHQEVQSRQGRAGGGGRARAATRGAGVVSLAGWLVAGERRTGWP